jgi:hypothetical protein
VTRPHMAVPNRLVSESFLSAGQEVGVAMRSKERNGTIDFWRGFALVTIFVNHIPGNILEHLTHRNIGFSDGAEAFVFISGLSVALAFYPQIPAGKAVAVIVRCLKRAFYLYRIHLVLTFSAVALFAAVNVLTDFSDIIEIQGRGAVFHDTARGITGILLLGHQLGYFNILPLYVVLMLWAPMLMLLVSVNVRAALLASAGLYALTRLTGWALPSWPEPGTWFFNPFAWQFVFVLGIVSGVWWRKSQVPFNALAFAISICVLFVSAVIVTDGFMLAPGLWDASRHVLDVDKSNLGLVRLGHFIALAYLLSQLPLSAAFTRTVIGEEFCRFGRNGLAVFAVGSFLSAVGEVVMTLSEVKYSTSPALIGMVFTLLGLVGLSLLARYLEWDKAISGQRSGEGQARRFAASLFLPRS